MRKVWKVQDLVSEGGGCAWKCALSWLYTACEVRPSAANADFPVNMYTSVIIKGCLLVTCSLYVVYDRHTTENQHFFSIKLNIIIILHSIKKRPK